MRAEGCGAIRKRLQGRVVCFEQALLICIRQCGFPEISGETTVLRAGDTFKILSKAEMGGEPCMASIAISAGRLFIRTEENLYCVGDLGRPR